MKFMVIARTKDSFYALSFEKQQEILETQEEHMETLTKQGKLKESYFLGNMKAVMAIFDLNSAEDLVLLSTAPVSPFVDAELTPLVEMDVVRKVQAKK